jgi:phosphoglycolate phosphatase
MVMTFGPVEVSTLIFDLDGTLIDSAPSILACMERVVIEAGHEPVVPLDTTLIGPPLLATLSKITGLTDENLLRPLADAFKARYDDEGLRLTQPYPEITPLLHSLDALGVRLHLATNKRLRPTRSILDLMGWSGLFRSVYTQDRVAAGYADKRTMLQHLLRECALDPAMAAYVGDTREDGLGASANGLHFFAVDWGYGDFNGWPGVASWSRLATPSDLLRRVGRVAEAG